MYMPTPHFIDISGPTRHRVGGVNSGVYETNYFALMVGTWVLTDEPVMEPPVVLKEALKKDGIAEEGVFDVLDIGESREY